MIMENTEDVLVCLCMDVCKSEIVKAIREKGLDSLDEVMEETQAGCGCSSCHGEIEGILEELGV
jgi:NAD(P)H-nitrite reductase large subunit